MSHSHTSAKREVTSPRKAGNIKYSICTLVTRLGEYEKMCQSFERMGFESGDCEYLWVDNSQGNNMDAFEAYNAFIFQAQGDYLVLCHQDVELIDAGRISLDSIIEYMDDRHPLWAVLGNAGRCEDGSIHLRISDPHGKDRKIGDLPKRVQTLDENFIVLKRSANVGLSKYMKGFHFYGPDLCLHADQLGYESYAVDFHLLHKSGGRLDDGFYAVRDLFQKEWAMRTHLKEVRTVCETLYFSRRRQVKGFLTRKMTHLQAAWRK